MSPGFSGKNRGVTTSVAGPGVTHPSDATEVWAHDNGRVPFPSIITIWGGGTLWAINWR